MTQITVAANGGAERPLGDWCSDTQAALALANEAKAAALAAQAVANQALATIPPQHLKTPEQWYASGNNQADDTWALQQAYDAAGEGGAVELRPGARYSCRNWPFKHFGNGDKPVTIFCRGAAEIVARDDPTADPTYLAATARWTNAQAEPYAGTPVRISGVIFNANGLRQQALVLKSWQSQLVDVQAWGATVGGFLFTRANQNGALGVGASSYLADNVVRYCRAKDFGQYGFATRGPNDAIWNAPTDITFDHNFADGGNAGQLGFDIANCGGLSFTNNRPYKTTVAGAKFDTLSRGASITDNTFDGTATIIGGTTSAFQYAEISDNDHYVPVKVLFRNDDLPETICLGDDRFWSSNGVKAYIELATSPNAQGQTRANKKLIVRGAIAQTGQLMRFAPGVSDLGQYVSRGDNYSVDAGAWV